MEVVGETEDEVQVKSDIVEDVTVDVMAQGVSVEVDCEQDGVSLSADRPSSRSIDSTLFPTLPEVGLSNSLPERNEVLLVVVVVVVVLVVLDEAMAPLELQREGLLVFGRGGGLLALRGTSVGGGGDEVEEPEERVETEEAEAGE